MENYLRRSSVVLVLKKLLVASLMLCTTAFTYAATSVEIVTSEGSFVVELYPEKAPKTVENFLKYVDEGFYKDTVFHRVISGFMVQGGGFDRNLIEKQTHAAIENESNNGLVNSTATIAMARTPDPNSATSQFFINVKDNSFLDYRSPEPDYIGYCVFGKVTKGMDVVFKMGNKPTSTQKGMGDVPIRPIVIQQVKRLDSAVK
jgi:cyclophilin family peptidyl-prolyl cis-trans isomerase